MADSEGRRLQLCTFEFKAMGSPCEIRLYAENAKHAAHVISLAIEEIDRLEQKYSRFIPGNFLDRINQAARAGTSCDIDAECAALLAYTDTCFQQSDGLFDITAGVLREVWDFEKALIPTTTQLSEILPRVGWQHVICENHQLHFARPGMALDLGGIVKEYAADCAASLCARHGIHHGIVSLGGDMHAIGPHPDGSPWSIKIRHPRQPGQHFGSVQLMQGGLASSGDYERFFETDGVRYCHILSPKTGWPAQGLAAVTVVASQCVIAGSMCTIAMLKEREGIDWLQGLGVTHLWMDSAGETSQTHPSRPSI